MDEGAFSSIRSQIRNVQVELDKIKLDPKKVIGPLDQISQLTKSKNLVNPGGAIDKLKEGFSEGGFQGIEKAKTAFAEIETYYNRISSRLSQNTKTGWEDALNKLKVEVDGADASAGTLTTRMNDLTQQFNGLGAKATSELNGVSNSLKETQFGAEGVVDSLKQMHQNEFSFNKEVQNIDRQIQSYFGLSQMIRKVGDIARDAFNTVKELDAAMTETAVVTNFDISDMWNMLPTYTEQANQLGSTIKDVYEAATLYYQQGLNQNQAMGLANETLKMARIGGLDAAEATNMMTAALRGFNMEINQTSAQKVNDIYSQLAAVTASDTREIGTAMEKTASLASSANMKIETTSAFLAQMIETTREAPENLGTAMKTIIARFQEMKEDPAKLVDSEGVAMDVNKVDTALKSIGVNLTNTKGEFRDLDEVFLEISSKWDSLSQGQQRYIATTAAGSRQQSRFIAMMSNYSRTMELVDAANNSTGASQEQFEKTLDSMSTKLNQLKNAWDQFTMGLMNNQILKTGVDILATFFTAVNKIISVLGSIPPDPFKGITKSILTMGATLAGLNFAKNFSHGMVSAGAGWWNREGKIRDNFIKGYKADKHSKSKTSSIMTDPEVQSIYQEKLDKKLTSQAKTALTTPTAQPVAEKVPVSIDTYIEEVEGSDLPPIVKARIQQILTESNGEVLTVDEQVKVNAYLDEVIADDYKNEAVITDEMIGKGGAQPIQKSGEAAEKASKNFTGLGSSIAQAGMMLQQFGANMGPLGGIFSAVGNVMVTLGTTLGAVSVAFEENFTSALAAAAGQEAYTAGTLGATVAAAGFTGTVKALGAALWTSLGPMALIVAGITALVVAFKLVSDAIVTNKEKLEMASDAAAKASEEYSSAKQATSELNDSLEQIQNNENAFDGLVAGTAEFNEKLIEANEKISELINKYPELTEKGFISTDENGLMHLSQEGVDYIKETQKRRQSRAAALNALQSAQFKGEEKRQEAERLKKQAQRISNTYNPDGSNADEIEKRINKLRDQSKVLEDEAKASERIANQNAISSTLSNVELANREKIAKIYNDSYEDLKKQVDTSAEYDKKAEAYAKFYDATYDKSTGEILDRENNVIIGKDDKKIVEDAYADITVLANIEANGESLDEMVNTIDTKFAEGIGLSFEKSGNLLTDILSKNADTNEDALKKVLENPEKVAESIKKLSDEEKAALLNITQEEFDKDTEKYTDQLTEKVEEDAKKIDKKQSKSRENLGKMLAQSYYGNVETAERANTEGIAQQINNLKADQINTLNTVGKALEENVGTEAMRSFIGSATDIYSGQNKQAKRELDNILDNTQWDSATSRLAAYTKMANSSNHEISELGKSMRNTADESNILGETFDEFLGGDWLELSENIDDFQNAAGEIDGSGILKMSEQSSKLKTLLDSGQVSASGLAKALQGVEDGSIYQVNDTVLQLLSSLDRLTDKALEAHNIIQNFDAGIDTGEGEDFVKENAEKAQAYYDNGEWGNEQLQNYIKLAAGEERWNKALRKNKGDLEKTTGSLMKYVNTFKDGFGPAWDQIVNKQSLAGGSFKDRIKDFKKLSDESKALGERFEKVKFFYDDEGYLDFNIGDLTTDELETYFEKIYGVSKDYASLLMQDLKNYDGTMSATLRKNDLAAIVGTEEFQRDHINTEGNISLATSDIDAFIAAGGEISELAESLHITEKELLDNSFKTTKKNGEEIKDGSKLLKNYTDTFIKGGMKNLFSQSSLQSAFGKFDIAKLIADTQSKGMSEEQSINAAYEAYKKARDEDQATTYEGMELEGDFKSVEEFKEALSSITESGQWVQVGQTIGQQIVAAMNANNYLTETLRSGNEQAAFTEKKGFNAEAFYRVIENVGKSGENQAQQQKDITDYLKQSKDVFANLDSKQQALALQGIVDKLGQLGFKPEQISQTIKDSLDVGLTSDKSGALQQNPTTGKTTLDIDSEQLQTQLDNLHGKVSNLEVDPTQAEKGLENLNGTAHIKGILDTIGFGNSPFMSFNGGLASGQNNPNSAFHRTGTMAQGSRGGYTISGRPTLTGEEGEELVWEPKRNEAYMVGSNGPQFADISKDAVVWNADQTKRIKKNSGSVGHVGTGARGITPVGTMAGGTGGFKIPGTGTVDIIGNITDTKEPTTKPEIPVVGKLEIEGQQSSNPLSKLLGKEKKGPTVKVTAEASKLSVIGEAQTIKGLKGEATVDKVNKKETVTGEPVKLKGVVENITVTKNKDTQPQQKEQTKTTTTNIKTVSDGKAQKDINNIKHSGTVKVKTQATKDAQNAINRIKGKSVTIHISPVFDGNWTKTATVNVHTNKAEKGMNNYIPHRFTPAFGSAARGRYGTVGPKNKGGLTLTGEKGYEIAWLPSENRSMILGIDGPQMITLPDDAVVYTHEQSEDILKRKSLDAGSSRTGRRSSSSKNSGGGSSKKSSSKSSSKSGGSSKKSSSKDKSNDKKKSKIIEKAGKVSVWWENQTRKVDAVQRKVDKTAKTFEKAVEIFGTTFRSIKPAINNYVAKLNQSIAVNKVSLQKADNTLKVSSGRITKNQKQKTASTNLTKAQKAVKKAKSTKSKKDDKKAKKQLTNAQKAYQEAYSGAYATISYEQTKVTKNKKGKKQKKKVTKKEKVNLADYIKYDAATGAYVVDQTALNKVAKKNGSKAKAIKEAANKRIDDAQSKKNTAEDNITKAQEALETIGQKIYDTFVSWEIELTKIWNITQKISEIEAKTDRLKEAISLQEAQLASGLNQATKGFNLKTVAIFKAQLGSMGKTIKQQSNLISQQKEKLKDTIKGTSNKEALGSLNKKLNENQKIKKNNASLDKKKSNVTTKKKALDQAKSKVSSLEAKKEKLQNKINNKKTSKKDKKKAKKELAQVKKQLTQAKKGQTTAQTAYTNAKTSYNNAVKKNPKRATLNAETEIIYQQQQKYLKEQEAIRKKAQKYMSYQVNKDGTISIDFNTKKFEKDKRTVGITSDDAKKIEEYVKEIQSQGEELNKNFSELTQNLEELYTTLSDLQEEQADNSEELLSIIEDEQQKSIDDIRKISESINDSINDLLNEVKNRLTERRNKEDNTKTQRDITQKQQRLAALRADTSGGNAVEIAQLEKEIADAQQSYERTLEDQLIDSLQKQADEASKQRETMIELQEAILETTGKESNLNQVNEWMQKIDLYSRGLVSDKEMQSIWKEIEEKYLSNKDYDSQTAAQQVKTREDFQQLKNSLSTNASKQDLVKDSINNAKTSIDVLNKSVNSLIQEYTKKASTATTNTKKTTSTNTTQKTATTKAAAAKTAAQKAAAEKAEKIKLEKEQKAKREAKVKYEDLLIARGNKKKTSDKYWGKIGKTAYLAQVARGKLLGKSEYQVAKDFAATDALTWVEVLTAAKNAGRSGKTVKGWNKNAKSSSYFYKAFEKVYGKWSKFASGGLADYTGPAWLDGTPTKPELVLNSKDTENFLILRDILGDVISSAQTGSNSYATNEFNIHVNVDKIANDYDVDKMITKIKKEITKSANYRNVTQVRNFR